MSGEIAAACCCTEQRLWYALPCPEYFDNYCCEPGCGKATVERIDFCESYLISIGIPVPPDPTKCYYISYDCCIFVLTGFENAPCPPLVPTYPVNVGTLARIANKLPSPPAPDPCCYPVPVEHVQEGGVSDLPGWQPEQPEPPEPCEELIAECYNFYDQAGTVVGKEVTITSNVRMCVEQYGIGPTSRCNHGPPIQFIAVNKTLTQKMGRCKCCEEENGECVNYGPCIDACPNERKQRYFQFMSCSDDPNCIPEGDCCGNTDPCEEFPEFCDSFYDPLETYNVRTCYSINNCNNDHDVDILRLTFPCCFATNRDVECDDAAAITALFVNGIVSVTSETVNTGWGPISNIPGVNVCGLKVICFSGNAGHIAQRINDRIGALVSASGIGPWSAWFWFGQRQSCFACPNATPNERPPASFGDTIYVDRAVYNATNQTVDVFLRATSPRWYVCATQQAQADASCRGSGDNDWVRNAAISAQGQAVPYALHCLSFPEYSQGARYSMRRIEETANTTQSICVDIAFYEDAPDCLPVQGFPLEDVYIFPPIGPPILVQRGWNYLCIEMQDPSTTCRCYPFVYKVAPCCPPQTDCEQWAIDHPLPIPCLRSFQSPNTYCETQGSLISIT